MWWSRAPKPRRRRRTRCALLLLTLLGPGGSLPAALALPAHPAATSPPAPLKPAAAPAPVFEGPLAPVQLALRSGQYGEAAQRAQRLLPMLKEAGQRDEAAALAAQALRASGQTKKAIELLEALVLREPQALAARAQLGLCYRAQGDRARERAIWNGFFDDHDAEKLDLKDPRAVRLLGVAARYLGSFHDSYEQLRTAIDLAHEDKRWAEFTQANLELTELRIEKHEIGYAETSAEAALRRDPDSPAANTLMARIKVEQGNNVIEATPYLDRVQKLDPGFSPAQALRAEILIDNEEYEEALKITGEMLKVSGEDLQARTLRAAALFLLDRPAEFAAEKQKILAQNPRYTEFHRLIAERFVVQHRYEEEVALLEEAVQLDPKDYYALGSLGAAYLRLGEDDKGYKALDAAWKGDRYNKRTFNLLNLYEDVLKKRYTLLNLDIDPRRPGSGGLRLRVAKDEEKLVVPLVLPMVQAEWRELVARYGFTPRLPLTIELYKEPQNYAVRTVGLPNLAALGVTFGRVVTGRSPANGNFNWALMIWHELSHVFAIQLTGGRVPRWFTEGLSEWETLHLRPDWQRRTHAEVAAALRDGELLSITDLNVGFTRARDVSHIVVAYHEAALAVEFLVRRFGFPKIVEALRLFHKGERTREVLPKITGLSLSALDEAFRADLRQKLKPYEGTFYVRPSDYSDEEALKRATKEHPGAARPLGLRAIALIRSGREDPRDPEIQTLLDAAFKLDPACKEALLADGERLSRLGKATEAEARFRELISKGGDGYDVRQRLGDLYLDRDQPDRAIAELTQAKRLDPDRPEPYERLAKLYTKQKREDDALRELEAAVHLDIMDAELTQGLVQRLHAAHKWREVLEYGEMARHLTPGNPELRAQLADAYLALGQPAPALAEATGALAALPDPDKLDAEDAAELGPQLTAYKDLAERARRARPGVPLPPVPRPGAKPPAEPPAKPAETQPGLIPGRPSGKFTPELPKKPPAKDAPRAR